LFAVVAARADNARAANVLAQEDDRWLVTLTGYFGDEPPADLDGFIEFARKMPASDVYDLIRNARPLGDAATMKFPTSVRRRYERLTRFPERLVVVGDAVCSFNPTFGQGMSIAAIESVVLDSVLRDGIENVGPRFFRAARPAIDVAWSMATGADLRFAEVEGPRTAGLRLMHAYLRRYHRAAAADPVLTRALIEVGNLVAPPTELLRPSILARVLFGGARDPHHALESRLEPAPSSGGF
jgi:2-polyprenyl-6-methoxyphenol hydroxylase-like FAD-dependent oxidoreductase